MTFQIFNQSTSQWVDILWAVKYQGMDGSRNDVDGPNAGRVIQNALMDRDRLATKYKWNFTTIPLTNAEAASIERLLMPEFFRVRTDYFTPGTNTVYEVYSNNVQKTYVINKTYGELVKLSFPIVER